MFLEIDLISDKMTEVMLLGNLEYELEFKMFPLFISNVVLDIIC